MPDGDWALLSMVIGFYFGGRMQLNLQDMKFKQEVMAVAKEIEASQGTQPLKNVVIERWLKNQTG